MPGVLKVRFIDRGFLLRGLRWAPLRARIRRSIRDSVNRGVGNGIVRFTVFLTTEGVFAPAMARWVLRWGRRGRRPMDPGAEPIVSARITLRNHLRV